MPRIRTGRRALLAGLGAACSAGCIGKRSSTITASTGERTKRIRTTVEHWSGGPANLDDAAASQVGTAPLHPVPAPFASNPVLTAADVTDRDARFVADPFLLLVHDGLHVFFEIMPSRGHGVIGHASSRDGGRTWRYDRVVLDPGHHVSYPLVFEWGGEYYMLPEDGRNPADVLTLYRAQRFPTRWTPVADLVRPPYGGTDHALLRWDETWWLLVGDGANRRLHAYYSDDLEATRWTPHANNPVTERSLVRPAGRPVVSTSACLLFFQDTSVEYGNRVKAFELTALDPDRYRDRELDGTVIEATGSFEGIGLVDRVSDNFVRLVGGIRPDGWPAWNADRMHHIDPWPIDPDVGWLCAVDGFDGDAWSIGLYVAPP